MKKVISTFVLAAAAIFCSLNVSAQTLRGGIIGGFTSSSTSLKEFDTKSVSLYNAGLTVEIPLGLGFAIQPSLLYQVKGVSLEKIQEEGISKLGFDSFETKVGFLELPVQLQWGPDLLVFRPYVFAEPFVGLKLTQNSTINTVLGSTEIGKDNIDLKKMLDDDISRLEYGLAVGAGVEFWHIQLSFKYFWNLGNMYQSGESENQGLGDLASGYFSKVKDSLNNGKNFNGISISLGILF